ncbi:anti-sigma factor family protein [Floridanema aerugineum]|jgi:anti-sigma factor RsiW|uniref:Anti-sigma factor n=1 Tax=Floridaenema aerugineum BLCC-F46 TaxID=3153654 RepID=A0ABV4X149_9CYAN
MTPEFESQKHQKNSFGDSPDPCCGARDMEKRDRFELLSAYLDGEVSATERKQVEDWLATDPQSQCLYKRLLNLRQRLRSLPVPAATQPVDLTVDQVFSKLENRRRKPILVWGGTAIAAALIAAVSGVFGNQNVWSPQLANSPTTADSEALTIALSEPVIQIPQGSASEYKYHKSPVGYPHSIK